MGTFFYVVLALLVGVLVGWFIWGRLRGELDSLRGDLDRTRSERDKLRADSDRLTGELSACGKSRSDLERQLREAQASSGTGGAKASSQPPAALMSTPAVAKSGAAAAKPAAAKAAPAKAAPKPAAAKLATASAPAAKAPATKAPATKAPAKTSTVPKAAPAAKKTAPAAAKPASGKPDNLRRLIGIGPVNEKLLKAQGVTTYAQIAGWTPADIKRIEEVMNFDGRIARERWIEQAKLLAAGNEAEFAKQFPTAGTASNT
ncbi:proton-conducting membrane transporter [Mesorhizobium sp. B2-3-14]|uniref:proton-conducting membrane transporter n=1 Tax=unclassified Mesorhizobium TaxID=325217 RepID=UPI00112B9FF3|nr:MULTISPECIES: proton-conducting membrane transporter [unclassified Mesorhizobium]MBZ9695123.1 proton-conducting membrane transporter [Mesorhizobium sp. CO1-1-9]TPK16112.1 proton-conducting membrane transporter [Mesorhizobium sp. B2-5-7]TPL80901.1 proton-conducting membrane transporter [Mesorhizobium sp. B2-3-14]